MIVYGMRHAIAAPAEPGTRDADRALTPEGARKLAGIARGLRALGVEPGKIWTSPYTRAAQTAAAVARALDADEPLPEELLTPPHTPAEVWEKLLAKSEAAEVLLVGHEPQLGMLAAFLLTAGAPCALALKRGAAWAIEVAPKPGPGSGVLLWLLQPRHLRSLGAE
ncbi:MAG: histidine phosphatase family protein [Planctomycetes bacterium]|nr:histidine phosphatase family protein [Planctomycetota bacterium]